MSDDIKNQEFKAFLPIKFGEELVKKDGDSDGKKRLWIAGYASTDDKDRYDDIITMEALQGAKDHLLGKTVFVNHMHYSGMAAIGRVEEAKLDSIGLLVKAFITNADDEIARGVRTRLEEGILNTFSIAGRVKDREYIRDPETEEILGRKITAIELYEVSVVGLPANPHATINEVFRKAFDETKKSCETIAPIVDSNDDEKIQLKGVKKDMADELEIEKKAEEVIEKEVEEIAEEVIEADVIDVDAIKNSIMEEITPVIIKTITDCIGESMKSVELEADEVADDETTKRLDAMEGSLSEIKELLTSKAQTPLKKGIIEPETKANDEEIVVRGVKCDKTEYSNPLVAAYYMEKENLGLYNALTPEQKGIVYSTYGNVFMNLVISNTDVDDDDE